MASCPDIEEFEELVAGVLGGSKATALLEHVESCPECAAQYEECKSNQAYGVELRRIRGSGQAPAATASTQAQLTARKFGPDIPGYRLTREIHRGGQGIVFEALQQSTHRTVAIKLLLEGRYASRSHLKRFEREIDLVAQFRHPNIITIFDSGTMADGQPYCVMDYVQGKPLRDYTRANKLSLEQTLQLFATVCGAVQYAHQKGVIHRDLKPSNILVDVDGSPKVLDFGLARQLTSSADSAVTVSQEVIGTLPYMSPEQAWGNPDDVDTRTDIYALGVILYELLTGDFPYPVKGRLPEVVQHIVEAPPARLDQRWTVESGVAPRMTGRSRDSTCPLDDDVQTIVLKALAKERERRYQSVAEFARDLHHYLAGEPIEARGSSGWYRLRKTMQRYRTALVVAVAFVIVLGVALVVTTRALEETERQRGIAVWNNQLANVAAADGALRLRDVGEARARLERIPDDLRGWAWHYLYGRLDRSAAVLRGHKSDVLGVAISSDGRLAASGSADGTVRLWEVVSGSPIDSLPSRGGGVRALSFSPDGARIAWGGQEQRLVVWNLIDRSSDLTVTCPERIQCLAFDAAGERLAVGLYDGSLQLWDLSASELAWQRPQAHGRTVWGIAFGHDGRKLFTSGDDARLRAWDADTGDSIGELLRHHVELRALAVHPVRDRVACGTLDGLVLIVDVAGGGDPVELAGHGGPVLSVAFHPDGGLLVSASDDRTIRLWDAETREELDVLVGHEGAVLTTATSSDGSLLVSGSSDCTVRFWHAAPSDAIPTLRGHVDAVDSLAFTSDSKTLAASGRDCAITLWDVASARQTGATLSHPRNITRMTLSADGGYILAGDEAGMLSMWDSTTGQQTETWCAHDRGITAIAASSNEHMFATASADGSVRLWDAAARSSRLVLDVAEDTIASLAFSPDGLHLAAGSAQGWIRVWDVGSVDARLAIHAHEESVLAIAFAPASSMLASASVDGTIALHDSASGEPCRRLRGHASDVRSIAFSPDGRFLVSGSKDLTLKLWHVESGDCVLTIRAHSEPVTAVAFSPDGQWIASASEDGAIRLWGPRRQLSVKDVIESSALGTEAQDLVDEGLASLRCLDLVMRSLRADPTLSDPLRLACLDIAHQRAADMRRRAFDLEREAWEVARSPSQSREAYEDAMWKIEEAHPLVHETRDLLRTLGTVQYRLSQYPQALTNLLRADELSGSCGGAYPNHLAPLAMTYHQLGRPGEARAVLKRLDEAMLDTLRRDDRELAALHDEAAQLISRPAPEQAQPYSAKKPAPPERPAQLT